MSRILAGRTRERECFGRRLQIRKIYVTVFHFGHDLLRQNNDIAVMEANAVVLESVDQYPGQVVSWFKKRQAKKRVQSYRLGHAWSGLSSSPVIRMPAPRTLLW